MATVLYIKANPKSDSESRTFQVSERFIAAYRQAHPGDLITTLDLYKENIQSLSHEEVARTHFSADLDDPFFRYSHQFHDADKYIFAAPFWNLGIPGILKSYLDRIMIVGITFRYTEQGPLGLCSGKKAVHITSRGGVYSQEPYSGYEMADRYLRTLLGFLGVCHISTIAAEGLDLVGADVSAILTRAKREAEEKAKSF
jgi:FMN-dependent NADH-azoreductase